MSDRDPAAIMAAHQNHAASSDGLGRCVVGRSVMGGGPCLVFLLAEALSEWPEGRRVMRDFAERAQRAEEALDVERAIPDAAAALLVDRTCPGCGSVHETGADWTNRARERPCDPAGCTQPLNGQGVCWCKENGHV